MRLKRFVPFVVKRPFMLVEEEGPVLGLDDEALMKSAHGMIGVDMHLADIDAVISLVRH